MKSWSFLRPAPTHEGGSRAKTLKLRTFPVLEPALESYRNTFTTKYLQYT